MFRLIPFLLLLLALPAAADGQYPSGPRGEAMLMYDGYEAKLTALLDAIPADKMSWRPGEGVRSFDEVFAHIADANLGLLGLLGIAPPDGWSQENHYEGRLTTAAELRPILIASFAHLRAGATGMSDATIGDKVPWFSDSETTRRAGLFFIATHTGEHEGQLVAYARVNGIVPPWSEGK